MPLTPGAQKVQDALAPFGLSSQVVELPASTHSAVEAAQAIGCTVEQIAKSILFRAPHSDRPILVVASGPNQVSKARISELLGEPIAKAEADFVRQRTGFVIGGVPPVGHVEPVTTFVDEDLLQFVEIWAAAGTPNAVFRLLPAELVKITGGKVTKVTS